jgi:hypothetical protein
VTAADGVRVYGNREAFRSLANWMLWIADANPSDHYECHTRFHMSSETASSDFELTFMGVEEQDLDKLFEHQVTGILPRDWFDDSE